MPRECSVPDSFCDKPSDVEKEGQLATMPEDYLWAWETAEVDGRQVETFVLKSCPAGHQLVNRSGSVFTPALQKCLPCGRGRYILDMHALCEDCPKGARCSNGDAFEPLVAGSVWEEVQLSDTEYRRVKRLLECPPGHSLEYDEALPINDNCQPCERGTYRLDPCSRDSSMPHCVNCDPRATCPGGDIVEAVAGYWRVQLLQWGTTHEYMPEASIACAGKEGQPCLFPSDGTYLLGGWHERSMTCMPLPGSSPDELFCARAVLVESESRMSHRRQPDQDLNSTTSNASASKAMVVKCPIGACDSNNTCLQNRTGPVCGFCKPGYSMNADGCSAQPCPAEEELQPLRWFVGAVFLIVFVATYLALSFRPVLPELDWLLARLMQGIVSLLSHLVCCHDANGDVGGGLMEVLDMGKWFLSRFGGISTRSKMSGHLFLLCSLSRADMMSAFTVTWWRQQQISQYLKIFIVSSMFAPIWRLYY